MSEELSSRRLMSSFNAISLRLVHVYHIDAMLMLLEEDFAPAVRGVLGAELDRVRIALAGHFDMGRIPDTVDALIKFFVDESLQHGSFGFLLKAEQPIFLAAGSGRLTYSWESTRSHWLYAQTYQDALYLAYHWGLRNKEEAKARR